LEFFTVVSFCLTYEESTEDLLFIDLFDVLRAAQICIHIVLDVKVDTGVVRWIRVNILLQELLLPGWGSPDDGHGS
jgi:hypothetical protein